MVMKSSRSSTKKIGAKEIVHFLRKKESRTTFKLMPKAHLTNRGPHYRPTSSLKYS